MNTKITITTTTTTTTSTINILKTIKISRKSGNTNSEFDEQVVVTEVPVVVSTNGLISKHLTETLDAQQTSGSEDTSETRHTVRNF
jgi:hypothetical protein